MKINLDEIKQNLIGMLETAMESEADGVWTLQIDSEGNVAVNEPGKKRWLHKLLELRCSDDEFHLLVNPDLRFKQEIDLMDDDIPDTVPETVEFLWEDIEAGIREYEQCFE